MVPSKPPKIIPDHAPSAVMTYLNLYNRGMRDYEAGLESGARDMNTAINQMAILSRQRYLPDLEKYAMRCAADFEEFCHLKFLGSAVAGLASKKRRLEREAAVFEGDERKENVNIRAGGGMGVNSGEKGDVSGAGAELVVSGPSVSSQPQQEVSEKFVYPPSRESAVIQYAIPSSAVQRLTTDIGFGTRTIYIQDWLQSADGGRSLSSPSSFCRCHREPEKRHRVPCTFAAKPTLPNHVTTIFAGRMADEHAKAVLGRKSTCQEFSVRKWPKQKTHEEFVEQEEQRMRSRLRRHVDARKEEWRKRKYGILEQEERVEKEAEERLCEARELEQQMPRRVEEQLQLEMEEPIEKQRRADLLRQFQVVVEDFLAWKEW